RLTQLKKELKKEEDERRSLSANREASGQPRRVPRHCPRATCRRTSVARAAALLPFFDLVCMIMIDPFPAGRGAEREWQYRHQSEASLDSRVRKLHVRRAPRATEESRAGLMQP